MTHPLEAKKSRKQIPFTTSIKNSLGWHMDFVKARLIVNL